MSERKRRPEKNTTASVFLADQTEGGEAEAKAEAGVPP